MVHFVLTKGQRETAKVRHRLKSDVALARSFRETLPAAWLPEDDRELILRIHHARPAAERFGLTRQDLTSKWVYLGATIAPYFWTHQQTHAELTAKRDNPDIRFLDFYAKMRSYHIRIGTSIEFP